MKEAQILNGDPLNGRLIVKIDQEQIKEDLGLSKDSSLYIPHEQAFAGASSRGKIVNMAKDAFGNKYKERYGSEIVPPRVGDFVHFVPYQSAKIDKDGEYYFVIDENINFVERQ